MIQKNKKEKDKKKKSAEKEKDKPKKSLFSFLKKKDNNIISKKITEKMNKEDIRTVTLYMKNGNNKNKKRKKMKSIWKKHIQTFHSARSEHRPD